MKAKTKYWRMQEAVNHKEVVISILDVLDHNPLFLNKCTSSNFAILNSLTSPKEQKFFLTHLIWEQVRDLFIEIKTEYYYSQDYSIKF